MHNIPTKWMIVKITENESTPLYKIFSGFGNDEWRCSSVITELNVDLDSKGGIIYNVTTQSGSTYTCLSSRYGFTGYSAMNFDSLKKRLAETFPDVSFEALDKTESNTYLTSII